MKTKKIKDFQGIGNQKISSVFNFQFPKSRKFLMNFLEPKKKNFLCNLGGFF